MPDSMNKLPSPEFSQSIQRAADIAKAMMHEMITLEHLLLSILQEKDVIDCLTALNIGSSDIEESLNEFLLSGVLPSLRRGMTIEMTSSANEVLTRALTTGMFSTRRHPMPIDILLQIIEFPHEDSFAVTRLLTTGLNSLKIKRYMSHGEQSGSEDAEGAAMGDMMGGMMGQPKEISTKEDAIKLLGKYCINLNERATEGKIDPVIGRDEEIGQIIQIMARRTKNNAVLVGHPGVGKTAVAEGLASSIVAQTVPPVLLSSTVYSLDVGALVAGTRFRGDLEERLKQVLKSLTFIADPILFIDEIHTIMGTGAGSGGSLDIANILKPALSKGELRCLGSTTEDEFRKHFEKDRALLRRFKRVDVREPDVDTAKDILRGLQATYEEFYGLTYTKEAIEAAVDLTAKYISNSVLPDKAIDIIDNAGARQRVSLEPKSIIDVTEIELEVSKVAKIPEKNIKENETDKLARLEDELQTVVFGQKEALTALTDAVFISRAGLRDTNKPAGAFLFTGPTGVGKTEAAKQLAKNLGIPILRYDMSEYMEKHAVAKLIGSPPGYVGYGDGAAGSGKLINDIETNPHCVLLLDEIEKSHPDVFNIFLQVMDDASLTSSDGKNVDFRNVIVIMTTNAGAEESSKNPLGFGSKEGGDPQVAVNRMFPPEFRNRLDAIITFDRLSPDHVLLVVDKFIKDLRIMAADRGVVLEIDTAARDWLAKNGYDRAMGARPLARAIHDNIKKPLSRLMITGPLVKGGSATVKVIDDKIEVLAV